MNRPTISDMAWHESLKEYRNLSDELLKALQAVLDEEVASVHNAYEIIAKATLPPKENWKDNWRDIMKFKDDGTETQTSQHSTIISEQVQDLELENTDLRLALEAVKSESVYPIIIRHLADKLEKLENELKECRDNDSAVSFSYAVDGEGEQVTDE